MSERSAHSPCVRTLGCLYTRNHTGNCSPNLVSERPSEGDETPLPCPFCGLAPTSEEFDAGLPSPWKISCECAAKPVVIEDTERECVELWNRRPSSSAIVTELERQVRAMTADADHWKESFRRLNAEQWAARRSPSSVSGAEPETIRFDELLAIGLNSGATLRNGMAWSFQWNGNPVTHENDNLYLVSIGGVEHRIARVTPKCHCNHPKDWHSDREFSDTWICCQAPHCLCTCFVESKADYESDPEPAVASSEEAAAPVYAHTCHVATKFGEAAEQCEACDHDSRRSEEAVTSDTPTGISLIAAERKRQVDDRGWTASHDDGHTSGELAKVAAAVAVHHTDATVSDPGMALDDPWGIISRHDNRTNPIRCLTIAGALIAAEIDRLNRARAVSEQGSPS